jgi:hypothetical protein
MTEMIIAIAVCFIALLGTGSLVALLMLKVQQKTQAPLIAMLRSQQKYIIANDLQVYQGILMAETAAEVGRRPSATPMSGDEPMLTAEELDRQLNQAYTTSNQVNGDLDYQAEP